MIAVMGSPGIKQSYLFKITVSCKSGVGVPVLVGDIVIVEVIVYVNVVVIVTVFINV